MKEIKSINKNKEFVNSYEELFPIEERISIKEIQS